MAGGYFETAVNRAYYAIFHAANALLTTCGLARSKHSGVISAFREHFVKPGIIEAEFSDIFGRVMDRRHAGDYGLDMMIGIEQAEADLRDAARFVERIAEWLSDEGWL